MTDDLLELALADPAARRGPAPRRSSATPAIRDCSRSPTRRWGSCCATRGAPAEAVVELRTAMRYASRVDPEREADVRATYGLALVMAGRTAAGLRAAGPGRGLGRPASVRAKVLMRRAFALSLLGAAARGPGRHAGGPRRHPTVGKPHLGGPHAHTCLAPSRWRWAWRPTRSDPAQDARRIFQDLGEHDGGARCARQSSAMWRSYRGDLPRRARRVRRDGDGAGARSATNAPTSPSRRSDAYLDRRHWPAEAVQVLEDVPGRRELAVPHEAGRHPAGAGRRRVRPPAMPAGALAAASEARVAFRRSGSRLVRAAGPAPRRCGRASSSVIGADWREQTRRRGAAARCGARGRGAGRADPGRPAGRRARARGALACGAAYRDRPNALVRASAWLASALVREEAGATAAACCAPAAAGSPLSTSTAAPWAVPSCAPWPPRTAASWRCSPCATRASDARTLLRWSERWRATALAQPPVTPDGEVSTELAALRDNGRRLAQARAEGEPTAAARGRAANGWSAPCGPSTTAGPAERATPTPRLDVDRLVAEVGAGTLVELVHVDGTLHVLVVQRRPGTPSRRRRHGRGPGAGATSAGSAMRRAARGRPYDPGDLGTRLQETLLGTRSGPAARRSGHAGRRPPGCTPRRGRCFRRWPVGRSSVRAVGRPVAAGPRGPTGRRAAAAAGRARAR